MDVFEKIEKERGLVARIYSDFSAFPESVAAHYELNKVLMLNDGPLCRADREFLAVSVSAYNQNTYCLTHHNRALDTQRNVDGSAEIPIERSSILGRMARELSDRPVHPFRYYTNTFKKDFLKAGYNEAQWVHAINIIAYFNFTNRLSYATAMEVEEGYEQSCN